MGGHVVFAGSRAVFVESYLEEWDGIGIANSLSPDESVAFLVRASGATSGTDRWVGAGSEQN